ncbi:MAG: glutamine-hydrolyzing carbamoyl-phosphate synthase small subunit [Methanomassiliicoccales archaeon]|nr:MAG: glutamine-hydrolyzing carbamoyl-phosphate synthase small subunit [Methanomassiliicoccales archaeon]
MSKCFLVLEDGTVLEGTGFGFEETTYGEVVFNTGMTGYQESLTDPSYLGQILIMSYPLIGNYGTNRQDVESGSVQVRGFVVRENCHEPTDMYGGMTLDKYLKENKVPGISDIDTRSVIIKIREKGTPRGAIVFNEDPEEVIAHIKNMPYPSEHNLVGMASTKSVVHHPSTKKNARTVALFDCGAKANIIRELKKRFNVVQLPYDTPKKWFRDNEVDGIMISNGPGDPSHPDLRATTIKTISEIKEDYPIMGICMGNQLLALAFKGRTYKLPFGHRGANQPVKHKDRVYITSQNHGYAVDPLSIEGSGLEVTHVNANDGTVEGMTHKELPIFSVQYHPEARPGPMDTTFLFDDFAKMLEGSD